MDNPRPDKVAVVDEVRSRLDEADAVIVTEYRGLKVKDLAVLRRSIAVLGAEYRIYKNTLVRLAADQSPMASANWSQGRRPSPSSRATPPPLPKRSRFRPGQPPPRHKGWAPRQLGPRGAGHRRPRRPALSGGPAGPPRGCPGRTDAEHGRPPSRRPPQLRLRLGGAT